MPFRSFFVRSLRSLRLLGGLTLFLLLCGPVVPPGAHAQTANLLVETNVSNATILVDGEEVGTTNQEGEALIEALQSGTRTVEVRRTGYWTASTRATLEPELTTQVSLSLMPRPGGDGGNLLLETNVADAVVEVDGEQVDQTGPGGRAYATDLSSGSHRVVVRKSGYEPATRTVTFDEPGLDQTIRLQLLPDDAPVADTAAAPSDTSTDEDISITAGAGPPPSADTAASAPADRAPARLLVDAGEAGAQVAVGDSVYGRTGSDGRLTIEATSGTAQITVQKEGFRPVQTTTRLEAGGEHSLSVDLSRTATAATASSDQLSGNFLLIFLVSLAGLAGIVAAILGVAGWKQGLFTRWMQGGKEFDRYDVIDVLQRSEFTTVYLASDPPEHRRLALKVLDDPYAGRSDHAQQFLDKGRMVQKIRESDPEAPVVEVYRVGREDDQSNGRPFVAHEHLQGDTLLSHLKEVGQLDTSAALSTIRQVCVGLQAAHDIGVHHGAVTPENIIVVETDPQFAIKLVGFGLGPQGQSTRVLTESMAGSTAAYVAPEQLQDGDGSWQSDMYAVGMLFYKLVTGAPPYADDDPARVMERQKQEPRPDLPDRIPAHVKPVFYRMISNNPDRRPTASRVVSVLDLIQTTT
jgi:hypothetical protein